MKVSQRKNIKFDSDRIISRLCQIHEVDTDADLSVKLGVARGTISSWRARGQVPWRECLEAAISSDVSLDWLVIGRGAKCSRLGGSTGEDLGQTSVSQGKEGARFTNPYSNYLVNEYSLI
ncbi:MAG TPA: hypothetical protein EYM99_13540, partial [Alphaproteobacteria bacterium]|nr:hypothetical protein [Alphaproteobacteria bacterium]